MAWSACKWLKFFHVIARRYIFIRRKGKGLSPLAEFDCLIYWITFCSVIVVVGARQLQGNPRSTAAVDFIRHAAGYKHHLINGHFFHFIAPLSIV